MINNDNTNLNSLFQKLETSYHIPSFYYISRILGEREYIIYHPWSQTLMEVKNEKAGIVYKLFEMGYDIEEISNIINTPEDQIKELLEELLNTLEKLKPREIITFNKPRILMLLSELRCNMRCKYCYTEGGSFFYGRLSRTRSMDIETARKSIDMAAKLDINQIEIFGGGEPLLNKKLIEYIFNYIDKMHYPMVVGLITNGTLIDRNFVELLETYKDISVITISIDGPKIIHNLNRVYPSGKGTFDDVIKGIELLQSSNVTFVLQSTYPIEAYKLGYTPYDVAYYLSQFSPFIILKFANYNKQFGTGTKPHDSILGELFIEYVTKSIAELLKNKPNYFDHNLAVALSFIARKAVKAYPCPFTHFLTVLPGGELLSCHMIIDKVIGHIDDAIDNIMKNYKTLVKYNEKLSKILDYRDFWYSSVQDVCPAELLGGLTKIIRTKNKIKLDTFSRSILEAYWDTLLVNVYKYAKENKLNRIYKNLETVFKELFKTPRYS